MTKFIEVFSPNPKNKIKYRWCNELHALIIYSRNAIMVDSYDPGGRKKLPPTVTIIIRN